MAFLGSLDQFLGGATDNSAQAYKDASNQINNYQGQAQGVQNPYLQAGNQAIGNYQQWLGGMQNPSQYINNMMNQYQQSPWAQYQQQQNIRAGQNAGSASGMTGSTAMAQQLQQNAQGITSQDQQNWLGNVLGINNQYGAGNQYLMGQGANSANALTNMYGQFAGDQANLAYNQDQAKNKDTQNMIGGALGMVGSFF